MIRGVLCFSGKDSGRIVCTVCGIVEFFLQICPFLLDLLLHRLVCVTDKTKQQKKIKIKILPLATHKRHAHAQTHRNTHTHTLISKLMVSLGSHPKATGVWEKRFLEKGFIIRTFAH